MNDISITIHYSNDRKPQFDIMNSCLQDVDGFQECEKILCCDGKCDIQPEGYSILEIERISGGMYSRPKVWMESISKAKGDIILYLDSDRIIPIDFINKVKSKIEDNLFIFPSGHFNFKKQEDLQTVKLARDNISDYLCLLTSDYRTFDPYKIIGVKNPMSGCLAFKKSTFKGVDMSYKGWRFADIDFFMMYYKLGYRFLPLNCIDLHLNHKYIANNKIMELMYLCNGIRYHKKWNLPLPVLFNNLAQNWKVPCDVFVLERILEDLVKYHNI